MSTAADRLARAEHAAHIARMRLRDTLDEIQEQMSPANLVGEAIDEIRSRGQMIVDQGIATLLSRPMMTTLAASAIGFLLRHKPGLSLLFNMLTGQGRKSRNKNRASPDQWQAFESDAAPRAPRRSAKRRPAAARTSKARSAPRADPPLTENEDILP